MNGKYFRNAFRFSYFYKDFVLDDVGNGERLEDILEE